jgi:phytoene synthase
MAMQTSALESLMTETGHPPVFASHLDRLACRDLIKTGSHSFFSASLLLPEELREAAYALYAFCRLSDDAVDVENGDGLAILRLKERLDGVYGGEPEPLPSDRCLADVVRRYAIPRYVFDLLLEGFEWDVAGRTYETLYDVEAYGERVAGSVGAMMAALLGVRDPAMVERACDLGVAMQLTNIARDIGEDAHNGRLYLPRDWFVEVGLDASDWLQDPQFSPQIGDMTYRLLSRAESLYRRADQAIARLPALVRPAIFAARLLYADIGRVIHDQGYNSIKERASTSPARKAWLVGAAMQRAARPMPKTALTSQDGLNRPLVAAICLEPPPPRAAYKRPGGVKDDLNWVLELFSDLEVRDRTGRRSS